LCYYYVIIVIGIVSIYDAVLLWLYCYWLLLLLLLLLLLFWWWRWLLVIIVVIVVVVVIVTLLLLLFCYVTVIVALLLLIHCDGTCIAQRPGLPARSFAGTPAWNFYDSSDAAFCCCLQNVCRFLLPAAVRLCSLPYGLLPLACFLLVLNCIFVCAFNKHHIASLCYNMTFQWSLSDLIWNSVLIWTTTTDSDPWWMSDSSLEFLLELRLFAAVCSNTDADAIASYLYLPSALAEPAGTRWVLPARRTCWHCARCVIFILDVLGGPVAFVVDALFLHAIFRSHSALHLSVLFMPASLSFLEWCPE